MSYFEPPQCVFQEIEDSRGSDPTQFGTSLTPANGSKSAWTGLGSALANDSYGLYLGFYGQSMTNQDNTLLVDLGVDPAGGTSFNVKIANLLIDGPVVTGSFQDEPSFVFFFPLFVKAGSTIGMRSQIKGATLNTFSGFWRSICKPDHPELWKTGSFVDTVGVDTANVKGTTLTNGSPDNTTYGAWTSLGTAPRDAWWLQGGLNTVSTGNNNSAIVEFSVGSQPTAPAPRKIKQGYQSAASGADAHRTMPWPTPLSAVYCPASTTIYARFKQRVTNTITQCAAAYLLG